MKKILIGVALIVLVTIGALSIKVLNDRQQRANTDDSPSEQKKSDSESQISPSVPPVFTQTTFDNVKTPHFVSSEPTNNSLLTTTPTTVNLTFNFDLGPGSTISVTRDGTSVGSGEAQISEDKLSLILPIQANQTGNYQVTYKACWPDGSCHNGSFGFSVKL